MPRKDLDLADLEAVESENQPTLDTLVLAPGESEADRQAVLYWAGLVDGDLPNYAAALRSRWTTV